MPPNPSPNDPACPSCRKSIKHGTPVVLKGGQTLHLRCWTLMLRGKTTALERNRTAQARPHPAMEHDRQRARADEIIE